MAVFDVDAVLRWARSQRRVLPGRRADSELPFITQVPLAGPALLLDSCVYIHQMQGRAPDLVQHMVATRQVNHSTVAVQELLHTLGVLNPDDSRTAAAVAAVRTQMQAMPAHRLFTPDADVLARAAVLAGVICRLAGYSREARLRMLQDATLFLQAQKLGLTVLTANISDFDLLLQMVPMGRVLLYRVE